MKKIKEIIVKNTILLFVIFSLAITTGIAGYLVYAQSSRDAVSIRVIKNNDHKSARDWYNDEGFSEPIQDIIVDGYRGVRSGRTAYVNVANIDDSNPSDLKFFTNIYIMSYNQDSEQATVDIFGQILQHWTFNTNIINATGVCSNDTTQSCLRDDDCSSNDYCNSTKSKLIHDTRRYEDLYTVDLAIGDYFATHGHYPKLETGTYLPGASLSTWPSWQNAFSAELGMPLPSDPVNKFRSGECVDPFNEITCWNEIEKEYRNYDDSDGDGFYVNIPTGSMMYKYEVKPGGMKYQICTNIETPYSNIAGYQCPIGASVDNQYPVIDHLSYDPAVKEFYIGNPLDISFSFHDPENHNVIIDIVLLDESGTKIPSNTSFGIIAQGFSPSDGQYYFKTSKSVEGIFTLKISMRDEFTAEAEATVTSYDVVINKDLINISADNAILIASSTEQFSFNFPINSAFNTAMTLVGDVDGLPDGMDAEIVGTGSDQSLHVFGQLTPTSLGVSKNYPLTVVLEDSNGNQKTFADKFEITVNNPKPVIYAASTVSVRAGEAFSIPITIEDENNNIIIDDSVVVSYVVSSQSGLNFQYQASTNSITGVLPDTMIDTDIPITLNIIDEYGAHGMSFNITIKSNTFCGDGTIQQPNGEGRGGPIDDGNEECDYSDGIATSPSDSSEDKQYECTTNNLITECDASTNPDCTGTCQSVGGYCGDGIIQESYGEECDEGSDNGVSGVCDNSCRNLLCLPENHLDLGVGCYVDNNNNGVTDINECQKGKMVCEIENKTEHIFCDGSVFSPPVYDYCCIDGGTELSDGDVNGSGFSVVRAIASDYEAIVAQIANHAGYSTINSSYYCDSVCKNHINGSICVGVGLNNPAVSRCASVKNDVGDDCDNTANLSANDCKARFGYYNATDCFDGTPHTFQNTFYIGETACYCWSPIP